MTTKALTISKAEKGEFEEICETLYKGTHERFFKAALTQLIAYKVWVGRTILESKLYGTYGESFIVDVAKETGISKTVLYEAVMMYQQEKLTPKKEETFIKKFPENYASWNEYKQKQFSQPENSAGGKSQKVLSEKCLHCPKHCI